jgi:hypothetical protein
VRSYSLDPGGLSSPTDDPPNEIFAELWSLYLPVRLTRLKIAPSLIAARSFVGVTNINAITKRSILRYTD